VWNSFHFDKVSENAKNASRTVVTKDNQIEFKTKNFTVLGKRLGLKVLASIKCLPSYFLSKEAFYLNVLYSFR
jgi:hypothetical protein